MYEDRFGVVVSGRITDLATATGSQQVTALESILTAADKQAFHQLLATPGSAPTKKSVAQGVTVALATNAVVTLDPGTVALLESVITHLSAMLA